MGKQEQAQPRNREQWLTDFTALILPLVRQRTGLTITEGTVKLSCGFPSRGGTRAKNKTIGECHHVGTTGERKFHQIFIHPTLVNPVDIGGTVAHEILHAMLPAGTGHRKPFAKAADKLGLEGKPTNTTAGEELAERIKEIAEQLGSYPHESLDASGPKQSTRLLKVMCPDCGYVVRVTSKWIDEAGCPICPQCLIPMEESGAGQQGDSMLVAIDQSVEYKVKATAEAKRKANIIGQRLVYDPRWSVRMNRRGRDIRWWVIDYGPAIDESGKAVLGAVEPRLTTAESRQDAISLLEALREGLMTYKDIETDDNAPEWDDPALDENDPAPYFADETDETADFEDGILSADEMAEYEAEEIQRQA